SSADFFSSPLPPQPRSTLFPYTTLFRSALTGLVHRGVVEVDLEGQLVAVIGLQAGPLERAAFAVAHLHGLDHAQEFLGCALQLRSEEHTSELQSRENLVCRLLLEKKKKK